MSIMAILAAVVLPNIVGVSSSKNLANNAYELSGLIQQARTVAMSQNTYVGLGFYSANSPEGVPYVVVGIVASRNALLSDFTSVVAPTQNSNLYQVTRPVILKNVTIDSSNQYLNGALSGLNTTTATDVGSANITTYNFALPVLGNTTPVTFSDVIIFSPTGEIGLQPETSGLLQPADCIEIGLLAAPKTNIPNTTTPRMVAVQTYGLSGQVSVYQQ